MRDIVPASLSLTQRHEMVVELPYSLHTRYVSIAISWTVILIPPIFVNLGLFYGLWYGRPQMDRIAGIKCPHPRFFAPH